MNINFSPVAPNDPVATYGYVPGQPSMVVTNHPLDQLAKLLKIDSLFITIPAIPFLELTESRIPLIYFVMLGLVVLFAGYMAIIVAVVIYFLYKKTNHQ